SGDRPSALSGGWVPVSGTEAPESGGPSRVPAASGGWVPDSGTQRPESGGRFSGGWVPVSGTEAPQERAERGGQPVMRARPSWTTLTTRRPSAVKIAPWARPRADDVETADWSYSSHSSARNGRWNHIAWSTLAICIPGLSHDRPNG